MIPSDYDHSVSSRSLVCPIPDEIMPVLEQIAHDDKNENEWALTESKDMLQTEHFTGVFDSMEHVFCFSYRDGGDEYWFQLSLDEVGRIVDGKSSTINVRLAD